jgi:hypothetical protein
MIPAKRGSEKEKGNHTITVRPLGQDNWRARGEDVISPSVKRGVDGRSLMMYDGKRNQKGSKGRA